MANKPLCQRAEEDKRQTDLSEDAWKGSGKVYGYRKLASHSLFGDKRLQSSGSRLTIHQHRMGALLTVTKSETQHEPS